MAICCVAASAVWRPTHPDPALSVRNMMCKSERGAVQKAPVSSLTHPASPPSQGDMQGQARAHRIGQRRPVSVFRLITNDTYELRLFERACLKLSLEHALLPGQFG
eukprot:scaffold7418_cov51-Isochrysis_galbana.AAC.2